MALAATAPFNSATAGGPPVLIALFALVLTFLALWFTVIERSVTPAPAPSSE